MNLKIVQAGDPVLRKRSRQLTKDEIRSSQIQQLIELMRDTMREAPGVGLAAPQVGVSLQLFVFDDGEHGPSFLANPELYAVEGEVTEEEGCLSIPGPYHPTLRARSVRCRGLDLKGNPIEVQGEGLLARILQHETDHLHGTLYIDRLDDAGRRAVLAELRRIELGLAEPRPRKRP